MAHYFLEKYSQGAIICSHRVILTIEDQNVKTPDDNFSKIFYILFSAKNKYKKFQKKVQNLLTKRYNSLYYVRIGTPNVPKSNSTKGGKSNEKITPMEC